MQHKGSFIEIGHRHLSRYRAHFEKLTRAVVEHHVANRLFREDEKRFAGLAWLNELDEIKKQQEARQDRISAQRWGGRYRHRGDWYHGRRIQRIQAPGTPARADRNIPRRESSGEE